MTKTKNIRIALRIQENITYKWVSAILKIEKVRTYILDVKRIGESFKSKGTVHRNVDSGQLTPATTKDRYMLKMNVFKGI